MKSRIYPGWAGFLAIFLIISCGKENHNPYIKGELINNTGCKSFKSAVITYETPNNQSCVNYSYEKSGNKLSLKHINAGFNCCPGKLSCNVTMNGDTLIIEEFEKNSLCDCDCLFDLDIEVTGVIPGKYKVRFIEPYCGKQEKILFETNLADHPDGSFCVSRKQYPWGL
jgi:hypothetical protein